MDYSTFKTYLTDMLWRTNDSDLTANLDNLIRMADAELNRKLNIQRREISTTIAPQTEDYSLPSDFYQVISLTNLNPDGQRRSGEMKVSTFQNIQRLRAETDSQYIEPYYYAQRAASANTLYLIGPFSASDPGSFELQYRTAIPDFSTDDSSWVEADYLDLYVYAVFKHCAIFLREEEKVELYNTLMMDALESATTEDTHNVRYGGSPKFIKPHRHVPRTVRKI